MAMQLIVLSDRQLASTAEWQDAISAEGFPLRLSGETPLELVEGFLPARLGEEAAGFECGHRDADAVISECAGVEFGHGWRYALSFRWPGLDALHETVAVFMASAAYAMATGGVILDRGAGTIFSPQRAAEIAREFETDIPMVQEILRRVAEGHKAPPSGGTSHADADEPTHVVTGRWLNRPK
jgi:hypothetical protein